jgi:GT2 family glycosyltransferase
MNHITITVPTRNRKDKLYRMLASLPDTDLIDVFIVFDDDMETFADLAMNKPRPWNGKMRCVPLRTHEGSVSCRNIAAQNCEDGMLYATDDIEFDKGAIESAFDIFNKNFKDDDGVVGFVQYPHEFHPTGVALIGRKFLARYPEKKPFYPDYFHFSAFEIYWLCEKIGGKFVQDPNAKIKHLHPCFNPDQMDQTHRDARVHHSIDKKIKKERKSKGLIWGLQ